MWTLLPIIGITLLVWFLIMYAFRLRRKAVESFSCDTQQYTPPARNDFTLNKEYYYLEITYIPKPYFGLASPADSSLNVPPSIWDETNWKPSTISQDAYTAPDPSVSGLNDLLGYLNTLSTADADTDEANDAADNARSAFSGLNTVDKKKFWDILSDSYKDDWWSNVSFEEKKKWWKDLSVDYITALYNEIENQLIDLNNYDFKLRYGQPFINKDGLNLREITSMPASNAFYCNSLNDLAYAVKFLHINDRTTLDLYGTNAASVVLPISRWDTKLNNTNNLPDTSRLVIVSDQFTEYMSIYKIALGIVPYESWNDYNTVSPAVGLMKNRYIFKVIDFLDTKCPVNEVQTRTDITMFSSSVAECYDISP